jgi:hypothetical protein
MQIYSLYHGFFVLQHLGNIARYPLKLATTEEMMRFEGTNGRPFDGVSVGSGICT